MKNKEGVKAIKAIDNELARLHNELILMDRGDDPVAYDKLNDRIISFGNTLNEIARRHNGLEY